MKGDPGLDSSLPALHGMQRFTIRRIARSQIKNADYNPRKISVTARVRLEEILTQFGLVESLVWNERTGNLVGGHQRLQILDALSESPEYSLDVAVVDLDEVSEKALNVALNAKGAQGEFDAEKIKAVLDEIENQIEIDLAGIIGEHERDLKKLSKKSKSKPRNAGVDATYEIVVKCKDEKEQRTLFEKFTQEGYTCRVITL